MNFDEHRLAHRPDQAQPGTTGSPTSPSPAKVGCNLQV